MFTTVHVRPPVKCGYADADVKRVKCRELLQRLSVNVVGRLRFSVITVPGFCNPVGVGTVGNLLHSTAVAVAVNITLY